MEAALPPAYNVMQERTDVKRLTIADAAQPPEKHRRYPELDNSQNEKWCDLLRVHSCGAGHLARGLPPPASWNIPLHHPCRLTHGASCVTIHVRPAANGRRACGG